MSNQKRTTKDLENLLKQIAINNAERKAKKDLQEKAEREDKKEAG